MSKSDTIILFHEKQIRRSWDEEKELWYFSVVDIIEVLTESPRPRKYWNALKTKLEEEGSELSQKVGQLKLESSDGKKYLTDVADTETLLRLIQSIPSPKAEPIKLWLAQVGYERLEETVDPELTIDRAMRMYMFLSPYKRDDVSFLPYQGRRGGVFSKSVLCNMYLYA
ncbi:MAG: Bro-N domain-containing protein [Candidatus Magasanikbacteria bacterium]|nr:Bro-N domain-containing protein [Candidatus Magasanikbacteria bacterium]